MQNRVFTPDVPTFKPLLTAEGAPIQNRAGYISDQVDEIALRKGRAFADEIRDRFLSDFEKSERAVALGKAEAVDKMAHVSTFVVDGNMIYVTYYANTKEPSEDPLNQTARLVYAPIDNPDDRVYLDLLAAGDEIDGRHVDMVYDTILMRRDERTLFVLWTARVEGNYYRLYCPFDMPTKTLGEIGVNRFRVGEVTNDFSASGIRGALKANRLPIKKMFSDIGIMQKLSWREENGEKWYYSGTYSGDFTAIIKSRDLITWEYVSQPDFLNDSKWENATYVWGDKVFYFVRQQDTNKCGFLTAYNLTTGTWDDPVEVEDCQSRGDFIAYDGELYLFHAPIDREHIGILHIDRENLAGTRVLLQAHMHTSCFYPFVDHFTGGSLAMSYTIDRKHIRIGAFDMAHYVK